MNHCPNIVPGMELTADLFKEIIAYQNTQIAVSITPHISQKNFGLLMSPEQGTGLDVLLPNEYQKEVVVSSCSAITAKGQLININATDGQTARKEVTDLNRGKKYRLVVHATGYPSIDFGTETTYPDLPIRKKHLKSNYKLEWVEQELCIKKEFHANNLEIAEIGWNGNEWEHTDFLPHCAQIGALDEWIRSYTYFSSKLENLLKLIVKTGQRSSAQRGRGERLLYNLCLQAGSLISTNRYTFERFNKFSSPEELVAPWGSLANLFSFTIQLAGEDHDAPFFNLISRCTNNIYNQNALQELISSTHLSKLNESVQHALSPTVYDWRKKLEDTVRFADGITALFKAMQYYSYSGEDHDINSRQENHKDLPPGLF